MKAFQRGDRVYHRGRREHGTYIAPATRGTALVLFDSGRVDRKSTSRDPYNA